MQQQQGTSLYSIEVGNLYAMEEAIVTFSYVRLLNSVAGAIEFDHQATWVSPYRTAAERNQNPNPQVAKANPVFVDKVSYHLSYRIQVHSSRGFRSIESPAPVAMSEEGGPNVRIVSLAGQVSDPSRDLTLLIELPPLSDNQSNVGQLLLQECPRQGGNKHKSVALATFIPRLPKPPVGSASPPREIIFVVDGSGSMGGSPIQQALEAALFFVKDLPAGSNTTFNAAMFGSSHQMMWKASKNVNHATQQDAIQWLQRNVNAGWGGTEVLSVLQAIYEGMPLGEGASRRIIFLTDGGISGHDEEAVYALVQGRSDSGAAQAAAARTCIFSLGIGHGVHRGLVEGVAKNTGGVAQFVVDGEAISRKAGLLKRCALAPDGACLTMPRLVSRSCLIKAAPNVLPPRLFADEPLHVLVELVKAEAGASLDLAATGGGLSGQGSPYCTSLPLDKALQVPGDVFAVLHAMCSIGNLLNGSSSMHCSCDGTKLAEQPDARRVEDAVVVLAEEEGLVTPFTSAVGVMLQSNPLDPTTVQKVEVPLQVPAGRNVCKKPRQYQQQHQQQLPAAAGSWSRTAQSQRSASMAMYRAPRPVAAIPQQPVSVHTAGMAYKKSTPCRQADHWPTRGDGGSRDGDRSSLGDIWSNLSQSALFGNGAAARSSGLPQGQGRRQAPSGARFAASAPAPANVPAAVAMAAAQVAPYPCETGLDVIGAASEEAVYGAERWRSPAAPPTPPAKTPAAPPTPPTKTPAPLGPAGNRDLLWDNCRDSESCREGVAAGYSNNVCQVSVGDEFRSSEDTFDDKTPQIQAEQQAQDQQKDIRSQPVLPPEQVLSLLNLRRTLYGSLGPSPELLEALAGQSFKQQHSTASLAAFASELMRSAARPSALTSDEAWTTVLALAYLRKYLASEQIVWSGLEARALEWLFQMWPSDNGRSVGSVVLAAMKLI